MPTMPHATARGCQDDTIGTSTSVIPKSTKPSARIATTCTATKTTASAPRYRWVESIHAGVGRRPKVRSAWSRPHVHEATTSPQATSPPARAVYHQKCDATQLPPVRVCGCGWNWPVPELGVVAEAAIVVGERASRVEPDDGVARRRSRRFRSTRTPTAGRLRRCGRAAAMNPPSTGGHRDAQPRPRPPTPHAQLLPGHAAIVVAGW